MLLDRRSSLRSVVLASVCFAIFAIAFAPTTLAQCVSMNLDGDLMCDAAESKLELIQTSVAAPVGYCDIVTNGADGEAFTFEWSTAGPGGIAGWTGPGSVEGSGYIWRWETMSQIHQLGCGGMSVPCASFANTTTQVHSGPFTVPGLTTTPGKVTASAESLTASYLSFFSPPKEQIRVDSQVQLLQNGQFLIETRVRNLSSDRIVFELANVPLNELNPAPACGPEQMLCGGACCPTADCVIGAAGFVCQAPGGVCGASVCGMDCVDELSNEDHCGTCFLPCPPGDCCGSGQCIPCDFPGIQGTLAGGFAAGQSESVTCQISSSPAKAILTELTAACEPAAAPQADGADGADGTNGTNGADGTNGTNGTNGADRGDGGIAPAGGGGGCGLGPSGVRGMTTVFVPDDTILIDPDKGVFLSVSEVEVTDTNGNGFVEPGETVDLDIHLINAGPASLANVTATLSSAAVDLDGDGFNDSVLIPAAQSAYPPLPGAVPSAKLMDCTNYVPMMPAPSVNTNPYSVTVTAAHPASTAREFALQVTATATPAGGGPDFPIDETVTFALAVTATPPAVSLDERSTESSAHLEKGGICACSEFSTCDVPVSPCLLYFAFGNRDRIVFSPVAETHDLLYGDLANLLSTSGNYNDANTTLGCLASGTAFNFVDFATEPDPGHGYWFLARGSGGSYDTEEPSQPDSRDGEIDLAPGHCPPP